MSYLSATKILPADLVKEIQKHVDGACLYVPSYKRKAWGSSNGTREFFAKRGRQIYKEYQDGADPVCRCQEKTANACPFAG